MSVCMSDANDDEDNDSELLRLLINERKNILSEENIKLLEKSQYMKKEYHNLENVNPVRVTRENCANNGHMVGEFENTVSFVDDEKNAQVADCTVEGLFDDSIEVELSDINEAMTRFTADDYKNRLILELGAKIESNISMCRTFSMEAKAILAEKMNLQRELNSLNDQIAYYTVEDTKYRKIQRKRGTECAKTGSFRRTYFCRFGIPYFKTKDRFPAEQNEDLKEIIRNKEVMVIRMPPVRRLLPHDTQNLDRSVLNQLKIRRIQQLQARMKELVKPEDGNEVYAQQIHNLRRAIDDTRSVNNIRDTKDWNIPVDFLALTKLNPRFSVEDYERMWKLLGNPSLSREEFSKDELKKLKQLVHECGHEDWDRISETLGTNRTGFVCFNKWVSLAKKGTRNPWSKEEDDLLRKLCGKLDQIKDSANLYHWWRHIRRQFPHRTYTQIHGHWTYKLAPSLKKGRFTEGETKKLEDLIRKGKSFGEIASIFRTRSSVQLRSHYNQIVERASCNSGSWTNDEEIALFNLIDKYGTNNWVQISKELGTRNRSQCRLKYLQSAWSPDETQRFQDLVQKYETNFEKIANEIGTKSARQCQIRYMRQRESETELPYNEGRWTKKETRLFRALIEKYKDDFQLISQELKTRNAEQCQEKYERMMNRNAKYPIKKIEVKVLDGEKEDRILKIYTNDTELTTLNRCSRWTKEEKEKFKELMQKHGRQFNKISNELRTKSIKQCRNMFNKMTKNEVRETSATKNGNEGKESEAFRQTAVKRRRTATLSANCVSSSETHTSADTARESIRNDCADVEDHPLKEITEEHAGDNKIRRKTRTSKKTS